MASDLGFRPDPGPGAGSAEQVLAETQQRWRALTETSEVAVVVLSLPDGRVLEANPVARAVAGLSEADVAGAVVLADALPEPNAVFLRGRLAELQEASEDAGPTAFSSAAEVTRAGIEYRLTPTTWHGEPAVLMEVRDDTTRLALAARTADLEMMERRFREAFSEAAIGMALVAVGPEPAAGTFLEVNRALCELVGRGADELRTMTFTDVSHPDDARIGQTVFQAVSADELERGVVEKRYLRPDGTSVWSRVTVSAVRGADGSVLHLVAQAEDITARKRAEAELLHRAMHDPLTGLPNRTHLMEHLDRALARCGRLGGLVGVLYLDVDDFKDVNDSLGHSAGDEVLTVLAQRIRGVLRAGDLAARLGGDELVLVCEDIAHPDEVLPLAERVVEVVSAPLEVARHVLHLTASVGVATGGVGATAVRLLRDSDAAMYRAKRSGKARFEVGDDGLAALAVRQIEVYDDLYRAVRDDQLRLVYQPIVDLATGAVVAAEALLRWQHPERGLLLPGEFIDVAESRELIVPIGTWVLQGATRQAAAWYDALGDAAPTVWVNVSDRQVGRRDLAGVVRRVLGESGLPAARLGIELTERQMVRTAHSVRGDLAAVRGLGVGLAIDDFGTGRTGMDHLRELPVTALKIDRSFVAGLGADPVNTALAEALVTLGRSLGLQVTAEGIETDRQRDMLTGWGCERGQGYLFARPQEPEALTAVLGG